MHMMTIKCQSPMPWPLTRVVLCSGRSTLTLAPTARWRRWQWWLSDRFFKTFFYYFNFFWPMNFNFSFNLFLYYKLLLKCLFLFKKGERWSQYLPLLQYPTRIRICICISVCISVYIGCILYFVFCTTLYVSVIIL